MASLGRRPGAAPLTSADIPAGSVSAVKVAADVATQAEIDLKADKASPTFTGTPAVPTAAAATNTTQAASTAYVRTEVTNLVDSAPAALDTLNELAAALGDDANFSTTVTNSIADKLPLAGGTMSGNIVMGDDTSIGIGDSAERIEFDGAGDISVLGANLGVGTTAPDTKLHIKLDDEALSSGLKFESADGTGEAIIRINNVGDIIIQADDGGTGTTERMRINGDDGNVGIGCNPAYNLDISPSSGDAELKISGAEGQSASIRLFADEGDDSGDIKRLLTDTSGNFKIQHYASGAYVDSLTINSSGKMGIGSDNPQKKVWIQGDNAKGGSDENVLFVGSSDSSEPLGIMMGHAGSGDYVYIFGTTYGDAYKPLALQPSGGNVGIGETSPDSRLHVKGPSSVNLQVEAPSDNATITLQCGTDGSGAEAAFVIFTQNTTEKWQMGMNTDNSFRWYNYNTSSEAMKIDPSGNITIGTGGDLETSTTGKIKQKGAFMQSSTHQALTLGY